MFSNMNYWQINIQLLQRIYAKISQGTVSINRKQHIILDCLDRYYYIMIMIIRKYVNKIELATCSTLC